MFHLIHISFRDQKNKGGNHLTPSHVNQAGSNKALSRISEHIRAIQRLLSVMLLEGA